MVTVEWDVEFRATTLEPGFAAMRAEKTEGSEVIELLAFSLVLEEIRPGVVRWDYVQHLRALQGGSEPAESYALDLYNDAVAVVHGQPLPELGE